MQAVIEHHVRLSAPLPWQRRLERVMQSDARFVLAVMGRRAGKTTALSRICGRTAIGGAPCLWGAPTHDIASIGRAKVLSMWRSVVARETKIPADIEMHGGGAVLFRSFERPGGAIGRMFRIAVVDEAARVRSRVIYEDVMPTLADLRGRLVAITTPRGRTGWVWEWYQRAMSGDPHYAVIHGPTTENPDPAIQEFAATSRAHMPESLYRQEILAEFLEGEGQVFRDIRAAASLASYLPQPPDGQRGRYVIGADVAKHLDYTVLYAMHLDTGEVHGCDRFNALTWPVIESRIAQFASTWGGTVWLDSTGVGDGVYDRLDAAGVPVQPVVFTSESKQRLVIALSNAMEKREIAFPDDAVLRGELEAFAYDELPSGKFRYGAPEGLHDDCVMALALAVWGRAQHAPLVMGWV